ncbi:MAG: nucleotidyltransferase family protein [Variibacter sp.]
MSRSLTDWLICCADPQEARGRQPRRALTREAAHALVLQAQGHGILPAVLRNCQPLADNPEFAEVKRQAQLDHGAAFAFSQLLRWQADAIMEAAKGLSLTLVKGPVFARKLYPTPKYRPFGDIDVLAAPAALPDFEAILDKQGFAPAGRGLAPERQESQWVHRDNPHLVVDISTDLIHAPSLQGTISVRYEHIAAHPEGPAELLLVAAAHGSWHLFERLQHLVDICQAARALGPAEEQARFLELVARTRLGLGAALGLTLAGRWFCEPRCLQLAQALGQRLRVEIARALISRAVVTSSVTDLRAFYSWRRGLFREMLKRAGGA